MARACFFKDDVEFESEVSRRYGHKQRPGEWLIHVKNATSRVMEYLRKVKRAHAVHYHLMQYKLTKNDAHALHAEPIWRHTSRVNRDALHAYVSAYAMEDLDRVAQQEYKLARFLVDDKLKGIVGQQHHQLLAAVTQHISDLRRWAMDLRQGIDPVTPEEEITSKPSKVKKGRSKGTRKSR